MVEASAPASSANLGPGFDTLALALELRCRVIAEPATQWSVTHLSENAPEGDAEDAVLAAARLAADRPLALKVDNDIPLGRGLGSSSAAFAAGALAGFRAVGIEPDTDQLFRLVAGLEGHPDNAAAAVLGGFVLVDGAGHPHRLPWSDRWRVVVAIPNLPYRTSDARRVLPASYSVDVVVRSLGRVSALLAGLAAGDAALLAGAAGDELHEAPRNRIRADVEDLIGVAMTSGAVHSCWSGAGPSVLALTTVDHVNAVAKAMQSTMGEVGLVRRVDVASTGAV